MCQDGVVGYICPCILLITCALTAVCGIHVIISKLWINIILLLMFHNIILQEVALCNCMVFMG